MDSEIRQNSVPEFNQKYWLLAIVALYGTFLIYSFICCPVPSVNEPHYLTKAKHYWNPEWCQRDFFLESSNPHQVYYQTVGILTRWLSLEQTAIISRIVGYLLLAIGWDCFFRQITSSYWKSIGIAWLFLGLTTIGNLSGEWMIGGMESKVFSYAFLLLAFGKSLQDKKCSMMIFHGLAISFHPVVGVWGLLANSGARFCSQMGTENYSVTALLRNSKKQFSIWITSIGLLVLFSLPGIIPALQLLGTSHDGINVNEANYIQVIFRLGHHLDPMRFPAKAWGYYAFQLVASLILFRTILRRKKNAQSFRFVLFLVLISCLFAMGGLVAGGRTGSVWEMPFYAIRLKLLKFYSFRLADVMIPMFFSVCLMEFFFNFGKVQKKIIWGIASMMLLIALVNPPLNGNPSKYPRQKLSDWMEVCDWFRTNTNKNLLVFTPKNSWAFKWYAERAEFVTKKDCPQDAKGLVEWNSRLLYLADWGEKNYENGYSSEELTVLNRDYGITHLVVTRLEPIHQKPVFENKTYRVYEIEKVSPAIE